MWTEEGSEADSPPHQFVSNGVSVFLSPTHVLHLFSLFSQSSSQSTCTHSNTHIVQIYTCKSLKVSLEQTQWSNCINCADVVGFYIMNLHSPEHFFYGNCTARSWMSLPKDSHNRGWAKRLILGGKKPAHNVFSFFPHCIKQKSIMSFYCECCILRYEHKGFFQRWCCKIMSLLLNSSFECKDFTLKQRPNGT